MNKITLTAEANLEDKECREWLLKLNTKIETLNERTKRHTLEFSNINKKIIELQKANRTNRTNRSVNGTKD